MEFETIKYHTYTCVSCDAVQKIRDYDEGSTCWELRDKYGWELFYSHGGANGKCPICQIKKMTIKILEKQCEDYLFAQDRYEYCLSLEKIILSMKIYKEIGGNMDLVRESKVINKVINLVKNAAKDFEGILEKGDENGK